MGFFAIEAGPHSGQASRNRRDIDGMTIYSTIYGSTSAKYQSIADGHIYRGQPILARYELK
jgi:hypothetical protein